MQARRELYNFILPSCQQFLFLINKIIELTKEKFGGEFNEKLFLGQLTFFEDIKIVETAFLKEKYNDLEIKSYLQEQVRGYLRSFKI